MSATYYFTYCKTEMLHNLKKKLKIFKKESIGLGVQVVHPDFFFSINFSHGNIFHKPLSFIDMSFLLSFFCNYHSKRHITGNEYLFIEVNYWEYTLSLEKNESDSGR